MTTGSGVMKYSVVEHLPVAAVPRYKNIWSPGHGYVNKKHPSAFGAEVVTIPWDILGVLYEVDDKVKTFNTSSVTLDRHVSVKLMKFKHS